MSERIKLLAREAWERAPYLLFFAAIIGDLYEMEDMAFPGMVAAFWMSYRNHKAIQSYEDNN